ncbi:MAG: hypothetical protein AAFU79_22455, partial [Myxococcota bacterium]
MIALSVLLSMAGVGAEPGSSPLVAVAPFDGPTATQVRTAALRAISAHTPSVRLVSPGELEREAKARGLDAASVEGFEAACRALRVAAVVRGTVTRASGAWVGRLRVTYTASGPPAATLEATETNIALLDDAVGRQLWDALGMSLLRAPPPAQARRVAWLNARGPGAGLDQIRDVFEAAPWLTVVPLPGDPPLTASERATWADKEELDGFIELDLVRRRRRWRAALVVIGPNGANRDLVEADSPRSRTLAEGLLTKLGASLAKLQPPPPPPPSAPPEAPPAPAASTLARDASPPAAAAAPPAPSTSSGPAAVELAAALRLVGRNLSYNDDLFGGLRPYDLSAAPALRLEARWFPGAYVTDGLLSWIGVEIEADLLLGVDSSNPGGESFGTSAGGFLAGLRGRIPLGPHRVSISLGGGLDAFGLEDAEDGTDPGVPSVEYAFVRAGADGTFAILGALSLRAGVGWRQVLSSGELASSEWFPNASVAGVDAHVGAGYTLLPGLDVQAEFELRRYFASFDPEPGDFPVAGGAIDQSWGLA